MKKIWENKGILFLLLIAFYAATVGVFHQLYKSGVFATKCYQEQNYDFKVTKTKEEGSLKFEITYCGDEVDESAKEGDIFTMDKETIHYKDFEYGYTCAKYGDYDYYVDFPDGETYSFNGDAFLGYNKKTELNWQQQSAIIQSYSSEVLDICGEGDTETVGVNVDTSYLDFYLPSEAPDSKYSPEMIRSAISAYQEYYETRHLFNSESEIIALTGFVWLWGSMLLCLIDYLIEWEMYCLSRKIYYETTEPDRVFEPSEWIKKCHVISCVILLIIDYVGMIYWYMSLR